MKSRLFSVALGLALLLFPATHRVWAATILTLEEAQQLALQNNLAFKAAQLKAGVTQAAIKTAGARLNPWLMSDNGIAEKTYRLGIEQTFELGGKRAKRVMVAQKQQTVVEAELRGQYLNLRADVRRAYTQLYTVRQHQAASQEVVRLAQQLLTITQKREQAGDVATLDVLQADIVTANAQNDLQTIAGQAILAQNQLNTLINQPDTEAIRLSPPPFSPGVPSPPQPITQASPDTLAKETLIEAALKQRPELQQLASALQVTQAQAALARSNRVPNLRLALGPDVVTEKNQSSQLNVFVIGNLELPVSNRQQGPLQEAQAKNQQLAAEMLAERQTIRMEVIQAWSALQVHQQRVQCYEQALLPKAKTVVQKSRQSFAEGKTGILTPLSAQQAYTNTRLGYLTALQDTQNAISDLERAIGAGL